MTFDDDFVRLLTPFGDKLALLEQIGVSWPPPEKICLHGATFKRLRMSEITDERRAEMTHVARGAEYALISH